MRFLLLGQIRSQPMVEKTSTGASRWSMCSWDVRVQDAEVRRKEEELAGEDEEKAGCEVLARAAAGGRP